MDLWNSAVFLSFLSLQVRKEVPEKSLILLNLDFLSVLSIFMLSFSAGNPFGSDHRVYPVLRFLSEPEWFLSLVFFWIGFCGVEAIRPSRIEVFCFWLNQSESSQMIKNEGSGSAEVQGPKSA